MPIGKEIRLRTIVATLAVRLYYVKKNRKRAVRKGKRQKAMEASVPRRATHVGPPHKLGVFILAVLGRFVV